MEVLRRQASVESQIAHIRESAADYTFDQLAVLAAEKRPHRRRTDAERENLRDALTLFHDLDPRDEKAFAWKRGLRDLAKALDCSYHPIEDGCEIKRDGLTIRLVESDNWTASCHSLPPRVMSQPLRALFKTRIAGGGADAIASSIQKSLDSLPTGPNLDHSSKERYANLMHAMERELLSTQRASGGCADGGIVQFVEATALTPFTAILLPRMLSTVAGESQEASVIGALIENSHQNVRCSGYLALEKSSVMNLFPSDSSPNESGSRWRNCGLNLDDGLEALLSTTTSGADGAQFLPVHFSLRLSKSIRMPESLLNEILSLPGMISANVAEKTESPWHALTALARSQHPLYSIGISNAVKAGEERPWLCVDSIQLIHPEAVTSALRLLNRQLLLNSLLDSLISGGSTLPRAKQAKQRASIVVGTPSMSDCTPVFTITLPSYDGVNTPQVYTLHIRPSGRPVEINADGMQNEKSLQLTDELIEHLSVPRLVSALCAEATGAAPPVESDSASRMTSLWKRLELVDRRPPFPPISRREFVVEKQDKSLSLLRCAKEVEPVGELIPPLSVSCYFPRHQALRQMASMADMSKYLRVTSSRGSGPGEGALARSLSDLEAIARMDPSEADAMQSFTQQMAMRGDNSLLASPSSSAASIAYRSSLSMDAQPQLVSPTADQAAFRRRWMQPQLSEHFLPVSAPTNQQQMAQVFDFVPDSQQQQVARQRMSIRDGMEEIPQPHYVTNADSSSPCPTSSQPPPPPSGKRGRGRRAANVGERTLSMGSMERSDTSSPLESPSLIAGTQHSQEGGVAVGSGKRGRGGAGRVRKPRKSSNVSQLSVSSSEQHQQPPSSRFPAEFSSHDAVYQASRQANFKLLSPAFMSSSNEDQRLMELGMLPESSDDDETDPPPPRMPAKRPDGQPPSAGSTVIAACATDKGTQKQSTRTSQLSAPTFTADVVGRKATKKRNAKDTAQPLHGGGDTLQLMMSQGGLEAEHIENERELTPTTTPTTTTTPAASSNTPTSLSRVVSEMKELKAKRLAKSAYGDTPARKGRTQSDDLYDSEVGEESAGGGTSRKEKTPRRKGSTASDTDQALKVVLKVGKLSSAAAGEHPPAGASKSCSPSSSSSSSLTQVLDEQRAVVAAAVAKSSKRTAVREGTSKGRSGAGTKRAPTTSLDDTRVKKVVKKEASSKPPKEKGAKPPPLPEIPGIPPLFTSLKNFKIPKVVESTDSDVKHLASTTSEQQQPTTSSADNPGDVGELEVLAVSISSSTRTDDSQSPRPRPSDRPHPTQQQSYQSQRADDRRDYGHGKPPPPRSGPYHHRRRSPPRNAPRFGGRRDSPSTYPHGDRRNTPPQHFTAHGQQHFHDQPRFHHQPQHPPSHRHSPRGEPHRWPGPPQQQQPLSRGNDSWINPHQSFLHPPYQQPGGGAEPSDSRFAPDQQGPARPPDATTRSNYPEEPLSPTEEQLRIDEGE